MTAYQIITARRPLPQLKDQLFMIDGGMETTLVFHEGFELPEFAAFTLLSDPRGRRAIDAYYRRYLQIARAERIGFILESVTWRASMDWGAKLGYDAAALAKVNRDAIAMIANLRAAYMVRKPIVLSGCVGPRGDGYDASVRMTAAEAERYHWPQIMTFAASDADMVSAMTITYADEAIGIVRAAAAADIPSVISFTVETDGRLPSGQPLGEAIEKVDAATDGAPAYFMINCAHPRHFAETVANGGAWRRRIKGLRANASKMSHAELDGCTVLDDGDPEQLAADYRELQAHLPNLNVLGGCCGTDHRHVKAMVSGWRI